MPGLMLLHNPGFDLLSFDLTIKSHLNGHMAWTLLTFYGCLVLIIDVQ